MSSLSFEHMLHAKGSVNSGRSVPGRDARRCRGWAGEARS